MNNLDRYKKDLDLLTATGDKMYLDLTLGYTRETNPEKFTADKKKAFKDVAGTFTREYQSWYTQASALVRQLIPDRLAEFQELYRGDGKRKTVNVYTYNIQDWLNGVRAGKTDLGRKYYDDSAAVVMRFTTQCAIIAAARTRFESSLHDIRQLLQADLFDSEIDSARELLKSGFARAAGAVAGVVLERHLGQVAANHAITTRKQHPTISDFNDLLKSASVLDVPAWRQIQRLGDLRNLCDHNKHRDPTSEEIGELIDGVEKFTKTLF